ncbi:MAG TPA: hypothetical protein VI298_10105 [Geobacteraceae bacterium]
MFKILWGSVALLLLSVSSVHAETADLSGAWRLPGGATFFVRQVGTEIWWFGEQSPQNPRWTNVAHGTVNGNVIRVQWVDVPKGRTNHTGTLALQVVAPDHLVVIENPNDFVSADWHR